MSTGLPFLSLPRPRAGSLKPTSRSIPELVGTLEPSQGREAYEQALKDWGFLLLLGLQPTEADDSTLWFHPKGVLLIDEAFVHPSLPGSGNCQVLAVLDMGFYHGDNLVGLENSARYTKSSSANLRQDTDGRTYQQIHFECAAFQAPRVLKDLQFKGRLGSFDHMRRAGELGDWPGRKVLQWASVSQWDLSALPQDLPPGLPELLGWIFQRAPVSVAREQRVQRNDDLFTLLRNQAKVESSRYGLRGEGEERSLWGQQAAGDAHYIPNFRVHRSGLTQATCLATSLVVGDNAARLAQWLEDAPVEALRQAACGTSPHVPSLPSLLIHQLATQGSQADDWSATVASCERAWSCLANRLEPDFLEGVWRGGRTWSTMFSSKLLQRNLHPGFGQALAGMAKASASAGFRWPDLEEISWRTIRDLWNEAQWKPLATAFRQWALEDSLGEQVPSGSRRPRF